MVSDSKLLRFFSLLIYTLLISASVMTISYADEESSSKEIQEEITKLSLEWQKYVADKDAKGFTAYFTPNAIAFSPGAPVAVGYDQILKANAEYFASPGLKLSWVTTSVEVSESGDMAVERGHFTETMDDKSGKPVTRKGKFATTWVKTSGGSWKALTDSNGYDE